MEVINEIVKLNDSEIEKIKLICPDEIEKARIISGTYKDMFEKISEKKSCHYHQLIWKISGWINSSAILEGYNRLLFSNPMLRTNFITGILDRDIVVTYETTNKCFPIINLSHMDIKTKASKIVGVVAAEARRIYNPQKSPAIRLHAFVLSENQMVVVLSFIPELCKNMTRATFMSYVFPNMKFEQTEYGKLSDSANNLNSNIRVQNVAYWNNEVKKLGKQLKFPGERSIENREYSFEAANKKIDSSIDSMIAEYAANNNISKNSVYMYVWLKILGAVNGEINPSIAIVGNYGEPSIYPVRISNSDSIESEIEKLDAKMKMATKYGYMEEEEAMKIFGNEFKKHFHVQFHFFDVDKIKESDEWLLVNDIYYDGGVGLTIRYNFTGNASYINYIFEKDLFHNTQIERVHDMYIEYLKELVSNRNMSIDVRDFDIEVEDENAYIQKMHNIVIEAIASSKIFSICSKEHIRKLSMNSTVQNLVVDDEILREGDGIDSICIISEGKIEESVTASDGIGKSLRILSEGNIIGYETLTSKNIIKRTYIVASDEATLVWIPRKDVMEVLKEDNKICSAILENVKDHLWKIESLWLME